MTAESSDPKTKTRDSSPTETAPSSPRKLARHFRAPDRIGPYKILELLGEGGMGTVYLAEQKQPIRRRVALKVIKLGMDTKHVIARFETERQALALMDHPNVARVLDAGATEDGRPYFVMEHVAGEPITKYCDRHRLNTTERLQLFRQVCHAVQHAHQKGIIHRDIKPSNVLVAVKDGQAVPKVIDFGVAKATEQSLTQKTLFTEQGQLIGTPEYMSPEQAEMTVLDIDTRTDIYSLGVMLYELLVGALPFDSKSLRRAALAEIQRIIREEEPLKPSTRLSGFRDSSRVDSRREDSKARQSEKGMVEGVVEGALAQQDLSKKPTTTIEQIANHRHTDPSSLIKHLRGDLDWIVMKAMEKDRTRRYDTASEFADDIARHLRHEPVVASPPSAVYRLTKLIRRNRPVFGAVVAVFVVLVGATIFSLSLYMKAERARAETGLQRDRAMAAEHSAEARRIEAENSRTVAERVRDFLVNAIRSADPNVALGRDVTVKEMLDAAVSQIDGAFPESPISEADLRLAFGNAYRHLGKYSSAEPQLRLVLEIVRRESAATPDELALALTNLAVVLTDRRDFKAAEPLYREAYELRLKLYGERDFRTVEALDRIAVVLARKGDHTEAERIWQETLSRGRELYGEKHERVADTISHIGVLLREVGDYAGAERFHRDALAMRLEVLGATHPWVGESHNNLAVVLIDVGKYQEAEAHLRKALVLWRRVLGDEHRNVGRAEANLAEVLFKQGKSDVAGPLIRSALAIERESIGDDHAEMGYYLSILGGILNAQGDLTGAEETLRQSLRILRKTLPINDWTIAVVQGMLGQCLVLDSRFDKAEPLLQKALATLQTQRRPDDPYTAVAIRRLVDLYTSWGKPARAAEYRELLETDDDQ